MISTRFFSIFCLSFRKRSVLRKDMDRTFHITLDSSTYVFPFGLLLISKNFIRYFHYLYPNHIDGFNIIKKQILSMIRLFLIY